METARLIILFLFLAAAAVSDVKSRTIPTFIFVIFGAVGLLIYIAYGMTGILDELSGIVLGIVFIAIAIISEGQLGMGDGAAILVLGIYLGGMSAGFTVLCAMLLSAALSVILLAARKASRRTELPFMPFLLVGFIFQEVTGLI